MVSLVFSFILFLDLTSGSTKIYIFIVLSAIIGCFVGFLLAKLRQFGIIACGTIGGFFFGVFFHSTALS